MRNEFYWMPLQYDLTRIYVSWQGLIWQVNSSSAQNKITDCFSDLNTFSRKWSVCGLKDFSVDLRIFNAIRN